METYHKIQTLFKRHLDGPKKGKMIRGQWTSPELEYLSKLIWEFTEKVDGTNIRVHLFLSEGGNVLVAFAGRSDNAQIPKPLLEYLEYQFPKGDDRISNWMIENNLQAVTLYGEGYGPKIQGGGRYRDDQSFVLFDVKIGDFWLDRENVDDIAKKIGIDSVPVIGHGTLEEAIDIVSTGLTFGKGGNVVRWGRGGLKSQWGEFEAEGIVARPVIPLFNRKGERIITKVKAVDFR